jgi:predicted NUDIX family NTP pyrophosphohydrolase
VKATTAFGGGGWSYSFQIDGKTIMPKIAAGLLMYRIKEGVTQVLLAHPGGPYFHNKDDGAWTIPKGEPDDPDEDLLFTAKREFEEETGFVSCNRYYSPEQKLYATFFREAELVC